LSRAAGLVAHVALVASVCAVAAGALAGTAQAARAANCDGKTVVCSTVNVPLDRSGAVPGTIPLHVEQVPAPGVARGVVFLVAGGPGQGSAHTFDLSDPSEAAYFQFLFPGYTLVAYDDRGTGASNVLDCPALDGPIIAGFAAESVADCATELGPGRSFYTTADHAADLDAVRRALGVDKIAVLGVSYGTKLALAYAAAYPQHVERLVLDSIVPLNEDESFAADLLRAMPGTLAQYCAAEVCAGATRDFAGDVVAVANKLANNSALNFLRLLVDGDLNPGLAAELPAAFHAARMGDMLPLLHATELDTDVLGNTPADFSNALYIATVCDDGPFPWSATTTLADRPAAIDAALAALPAGSLGPFGTWAASLGDADVCAGWPTATSDIAGPAGPLPDVPVLGFSGGLDLRTPTSGATAVLSQFPHGHLVVVPGVGHSVLTSDQSLCAQKDLRNWILSGAVPESCAPARPFLLPLTAFPITLSRRLGPAQTLVLATKTVQEAEAAWLATAGISEKPATVLGIYTGKLVATPSTITLAKYSLGAGVTVTGRITVTDVGPPAAFSGSVKVAGSAASPGTLILAHGLLRGRLGNRKVGG
jgi:pimeloyl-ACP methyl ester carboxylesterase